MARDLAKRPDGMVNVSLDPDAVKALDEACEGLLAKELGFKPKRSQALRYLLKRLEQKFDV